MPSVQLTEATNQQIFDELLARPTFLGVILDYDPTRGAPGSWVRQSTEIRTSTALAADANLAKAVLRNAGQSVH